MSEDLKQRPMVMFQPSGRRGHVSDGKTIAQAAQEMGVDIKSICGGKGTCGKCKVRIEKGFWGKHGIRSHIDNITPIGEAEKKMLTPRQ